MKSVLVFLLAAIACSYCIRIREERGVLVADKSNWRELFRQYPNVLVAFYAPWCGWSRKMLVQLEAAAMELKRDRSNRIRFVKYDASNDASTRNIYQIRGYPTLIYFKNGDSSASNGEMYARARSKASFVRYAKEKSGRYMGYSLPDTSSNQKSHECSA